MATIDERMKASAAAQGEELWNAVRDANPDVVARAAMNRNLTDEMAVYIVKRKSVLAETLGLLAADVRFRNNYPLKLAICRNPKTPQKAALSLLKFIRVFDLADIAKDQRLPINIRQKVEHLIFEKIPAMPLGNKTSLARRAGTNVLLALMAGGDERLISVCLESPALTEAHLYKLINSAGAKPAVVRMISAHPKWALSYYIRFALIRNFYTPMGRVDQFIRGMRTPDLRDLYADPKVPTSTKPFIFRELGERGETVDIIEDEIYDLPEDINEE
jgi:hypothetical protein